MPKVVSFILHGKNRGSNKIVNQLQRLFGNSYTVNFLYTAYAGHAVELARQAATTSQYVIAAGGDGTLHEVVNGIMLSGNKNVITGLLPLGTGNDFAKTIGVTNSPTHLYQLIESNSVQLIDVGLVHCHNADGAPVSRYFINIADVGLGGAIAQRLAGYSKWMGAFLTFQRAIIAGFLSYRHQPVKAVADTFTHQGNILSYIIANGKYFGAGLGIAPHAQPADGRFAITLGAGISLWDYLLNLGKVRQCQIIKHPEMHYQTATRVDITSAVKLPIDMDGEFGGYTPMQVSIVPGALHMLCRL